MKLFCTISLNVLSQNTTDDQTVIQKSLLLISTVYKTKNLDKMVVKLDYSNLMNTCNINEAMSLLPIQQQKIPSMSNSMFHNYFMSKVFENINM